MVDFMKTGTVLEIEPSSFMPSGTKVLNWVT